MADSIFTKIIHGELPCHKVYEDDKTLAFMDIFPLREGHVLVIPKNQVDLLWDLDEADYQAVMTTVKLVAKRIKEVLKPIRVGVHVAGLDVPHAHVHVFPFNDMTEFWDKPSGKYKPSAEELEQVAQKLAF